MLNLQKPKDHVYYPCNPRLKSGGVKRRDDKCVCKQFKGSMLDWNLTCRQRHQQNKGEAPQEPPTPRGHKELPRKIAVNRPFVFGF